MWRHQRLRQSGAHIRATLYFQDRRTCVRLQQTSIRSLASGIVDRVRLGFADAKRYDKYRPSYPEATLNKLIEVAGINGVKQARVLEIAAGTGKLTEQLYERDENFDIIATEPHAAMREVLIDKKLSRVRVKDALADNMTEVETGWADLVVTAQSFHWFANQSALREINRVLKPGAVLAMIWNMEDYTRAPYFQTTTKWEEVIKNRIKEGRAFAPGAPVRRWQDAFQDSNGVSKTAYFDVPLSEHRFVRTERLSRDAIWGRVSTLSEIAVQDRETFDKSKEVVYDAMNNMDADVDGDGRLALHGMTQLCWAAQKPEAHLR